MKAKRLDICALLGLLFVGFATLAFGGAPLPEAPAVDTQTKESQDDEAREGITFPNFKPSEFPFLVVLPDDGTDKGGGWQSAKANLEFTRISLPLKVTTWFCPFRVEMPLRTELRGKVDAILAATMSAAVANSVVATMDYKLPQGIFCERFIDGMRKSFPVMYPGLGASVLK